MPPASSSRALAKSTSRPPTPIASHFRSYAARSDMGRSTAATFELAHDEKIFGCGESFTRLNKRGQKVILYLRDGMGVQSQKMYKPIPFFLSSNGYGMFVHTSTPVTLRLRQLVRPIERDLHGRRHARHLRLPRRAEGHPLGIHGHHRPQPRAAAVVVRSVDEPHHLQVGGRSPRRGRQASRPQDSLRRDPSRHRLVRDRLAMQLQVRSVAIQRSEADDGRLVEDGLPHQPLAAALLHDEERALRDDRQEWLRSEE